MSFSIHGGNVMLRFKLKCAALAILVFLTQVWGIIAVNADFVSVPAITNMNRDYTMNNPTVVNKINKCLYDHETQSAVISGPFLYYGVDTSGNLNLFRGEYNVRFADGCKRVIRLQYDDQSGGISTNMLYIENNDSMFIDENHIFVCNDYVCYIVTSDGIHEMEHWTPWTAEDESVNIVVKNMAERYGMQLYMKSPATTMIFRPTQVSSTPGN